MPVYGRRRALHTIDEGAAARQRRQAAAPARSPADRPTRISAAVHQACTFVNPLLGHTAFLSYPISRVECRQDFCRTGDGAGDSGRRLDDTADVEESGRRRPVTLSSSRTFDHLLIAFLSRDGTRRLEVCCGTSLRLTVARKVEQVCFFVSLSFPSVSCLFLSHSLWAQLFAMSSLAIIGGC